MPNASGKVLGKTSASQAGTTRATSSCSRRPERRRSRRLAGELGVASGGSGRNAPGGGAGPPPRPRAPSRGGDLGGGVKVAVGRAPATGPRDSAELAEAGDQQARAGVLGVDERPGREQQVGALRDDQLADEDHARALGLGQPSHGGGGLGGVAVPGASLVRVAVGRWLDGGEGDGKRLQAARRLGPRDRRERRRVDARRPERDLRVHLGLVDRQPEPLGDVLGADQDPRGRPSALERVGPESLEVREHRVGEVRAVDLDREPDPSRAGEDHRPHHEVVGERRLEAAGARRRRRSRRRRCARCRRRARRRSAPGTP